MLYIDPDEQVIALNAPLFTRNAYVPLRDERIKQRVSSVVLAITRQIQRASRALPTIAPSLSGEPDVDMTASIERTTFYAVWLRRSGSILLRGASPEWSTHVVLVDDAHAHTLRALLRDYVMS